MEDKEKFNALSQLFQGLEQIIDKQCDRVNKALIRSGKPSLETTCPHCKYVIKPFDWDFDEDERVPLCPNCGQEIDLPEGY